MTQSFMDPSKNLFIALIPLYISEQVLTFGLRIHKKQYVISPSQLALRSDLRSKIACLHISSSSSKKICKYTGVVVAIFVEYSIPKFLLNQFKSAGWERMEERAKQIP